MDSLKASWPFLQLWIISWYSTFVINYYSITLFPIFKSVFFIFHLIRNCYASTEGSLSPSFLSSVFQSHFSSIWYYHTNFSIFLLAFPHFNLIPNNFVFIFNSLSPFQRLLVYPLFPFLFQSKGSPLFLSLLIVSFPWSVVVNIFFVNYSISFSHPQFCSNQFRCFFFHAPH